MSGYDTLKKFKLNHEFEDEHYDYHYCIDCRIKQEEDKKVRDEKFLTAVEPYVAKNALRYRNMEITDENTALISEFLLAKRINRKMKEILL